MAVVAPYLVGVVTAPLVVKVVKVLVRSTVKASVVIRSEVKKVAAEASEEFQDLAAEVSVDKAAEGKIAEASLASDAAAEAARARGAGGAWREGDEKGVVS